jgi:hypothetical protein
MGCPAALPTDPSPCTGPVAVMVIDPEMAGARGCEHHAAVLLAAIPGSRPVALPDASAGAALRVHAAAGPLTRTTGRTWSTLRQLAADLTTS